MRLSRYIFVGAVVRLAVALPATTLLYAVIDLADRGPRAAVQAGWPAALYAELLHLPLVMAQLMPAALLISLTLWLAGLRRRGELEALAALGGSPRAILAPVLLLAAGVGFAGHLLAEVVAPACERAADAALGAPQRSALTGLDHGTRWRRAGSWRIHRARAGGKTAAVVAIELDGKHRPLTRIEGLARPGAPDQLSGARRYHLGDGALRRISTAEPLYLAPLGAIAGAWRPLRAEAQSAAELTNALERRVHLGRAGRAERLVLQTKRAYPLLSLAFALFALSTLAAPRRRPAILDLLGCGGALLLSWLLIAAGWSLTRGGLLSPALGAWLPVVVICLVGLWRARIKIT